MVLAVALAWMRQPALSGMSYVLIGPLQTALGMRHGGRHRALTSQTEAAAA